MRGKTLLFSLLYVRPTRLIGNFLGLAASNQFVEEIADCGKPTSSVASSNSRFVNWPRFL